MQDAERLKFHKEIILLEEQLKERDKRIAELEQDVLHWKENYEWTIRELNK